MKILHLNYYESQGGAAIAVQRIHNALLAKNIDSQIIVSKKNSNNPKVIGPNSTFEEILNLLKISFQRKLNKFSSLKTDFSQSYNLIPSNILDKIKKNNGPLICEVFTSENQSSLFKQGYKEVEKGKFEPQPLSEMYPFFQKGLSNTNN